MRHKILQLKRIRELRAQQKQRETSAARAAVAAADKALEMLGLEYRAVQREIQAARLSLSQPGTTLTGVEIEQQLQKTARLEGYLRAMVPRVKAADQARKRTRVQLDEAKERQKAADRSVDQILQLDKRLEAEETAEAERLEEMQEEPRAKPPLFPDDRG